MRTVKVTRKTTESEMGITLDFSPLKEDYRSDINTPIPFLNHMIEHIAYRGGFNIKTTLKLADYSLIHVIAEDLGIALGKAVKEYIDTTDGAVGFGDAVGIIDEASAGAAISFALFVKCDEDKLSEETMNALREAAVPHAKGVDVTVLKWTKAYDEKVLKDSVPLYDRELGL